MAEGQSKLFHAIVGLGLAAAGCGADSSLLVPTRTDAGLKTSAPRPDAAPDASRDAGVMSEPPPVRDAGTPRDVFVLSQLDAGFDAGFDAAHDAAHDASVPPPPDVK